MGTYVAKKQSTQRQRQWTRGNWVKWLKNPPNDNGWTRVCDIVVDYRKGKTPIFFTNSKGELDHYLDGVCPRR